MLLLIGPAIRAQRPSREAASQLTANFEAAGAQAVQQLVDSMALGDVLSQILIDKAVEGARKGVSVSRVLPVVRSYAGHLKTAQSILGRGERSDVYQSAANALLAGVSAAVIHQLRAQRPAAALVFPLVVVTDLTLRGVAEDSAAAYVTRLLAADARDSDLAELQQSVARGIVAGTRPADAASNATQQALRRINIRATPNARPPGLSPPRGPSTDPADDLSTSGP